MTHIREATYDDVPKLVEVFNEARSVGMPWLPQLHTIADDMAFFTRRVLPNHTVLVHETDGQIDGFIGYSQDWIDHLYLAPKAWRSGIGSNLLARGLHDVSYRQLWVFKMNTRAQAFYIQHGFEPIEETDGSNNEEKCPDIRMEWHAIGSS